MPKSRVSPNLPEAKKLTRQVLRDNPLLGKLARMRLKDIKTARDAKQASELDLD